MNEVDLPNWAAWWGVPLALDGEPVRHRVMHGGRGGAKSWTAAIKLVLRAMQDPHRILCLREFQNSLADSSKKLIEDIIERMGLGPSGNRFFQFTDREIRGRNGSVFLFLGLAGREAAIKSLEGVTIAWVEEAATVSQASIDALIPTIRTQGSEIWWTYNPRFPSDPVDRLFRGESEPPPGSIVVEVQWRDNPWFPDVLRREMDYDAVRDPDKHAHVWEGHYVRHSEAAVFKHWQVAAFETPENAVVRFGADWGFAKDPTVLIRCFIGRWAGASGASEVIADSEGRCLFIDHEAYKIGCDIDDTPALFAGSDTALHAPRWSNPRAHPGVTGSTRYKITADGSRPETIAYMKKRGFMIEAAVKGSGSVEEGISFLRSYDIYVHPRCRQTAIELAHYSWKIDRQTGAIIPKLSDDNNHVIDALRYALEGVRRAGSSNDLDIRTTGPRIMADLQDTFLADIGSRHPPYTKAFGPNPPADVARWLRSQGGGWPAK